MRLDIDSGGSDKGVSEYDIYVAPDPKTGKERRGSAKRLAGLAPRITRLSRKVLGESFLRLNQGNGFLTLCVKTGTSKAMRREFRSLCGWIELCDEAGK